MAEIGTSFASKAWRLYEDRLRKHPPAAPDPRTMILVDRERLEMSLAHPRPERRRIGSRKSGPGHRRPDKPTTLTAAEDAREAKRPRSYASKVCDTCGQLYAPTGSRQTTCAPCKEAAA